MSLEKIFRKEVLNLPSYHLEEHPGIKLNQNESPWDLPPALKAKIAENLLKIPWNRYPLGDTLLLKKKMAKHLKVWPDSLVFANGSNVLIQALVMATAIKSKLLIVDPTFGVYEIEGQLFGNTMIVVRLNEDFSLPGDCMLEAIKKEKPALVFIANPNAPTGNLFDPHVLQEIIEAAPGLVVIDEAYYPFSGFSAVEWLKQYDHLVILRTFSKAFALGGLRLGYLIAEPEIAAQISKCLLPFCVGKLSLVCALTVLDEPQYMMQYVSAICEERDRVYEEMKKINSLTVYPTKANFILFEIDNASDVFKKLIKKGIVIRDVRKPGRLEKALRVTIGSKEENDAFLKAIR